MKGLADDDADGPQIVDNPFFARLWSTMSAREPESIRALRRENLAGLTGRVLEIGAGTGTNFALYPRPIADRIEPERRARRRSARERRRERRPCR